MLRILKVEVKEVFQCSLTCEVLKYRTDLPHKDICKTSVHISKYAGNCMRDLGPETSR